MGKTIHTDSVELLFEAIHTLKTKEEYFAFFEDLCTVNEVLSLAQRIEVAQKLEEGSTYLEVTNDTGASTATISRVNRMLNYGTDGLKTALERIREQGKTL
ncbi:MAG: YerC/YecD family TrpR-related protein [Bacteroides sp.]|nr:YerC/YecD family TrpR-related protein [Bacteroides sp.]MCM1550580.1 YerC/YecD family TrpR-related protein [Clostridium sp.]